MDSPRGVNGISRTPSMESMETGVTAPENSNFEGMGGARRVSVVTPKGSEKVDGTYSQDYRVTVTPGLATRWIVNKSAATGGMNPLEGKTKLRGRVACFLKWTSRLTGVTGVAGLIAAGAMFAVASLAIMNPFVLAAAAGAALVAGIILYIGRKRFNARHNQAIFDAQASRMINQALAELKAQGKLDDKDALVEKLEGIDEHLQDHLNGKGLHSVTRLYIDHGKFNISMDQLDTIMTKTDKVYKLYLRDDIKSNSLFETGELQSFIDRHNIKKVNFYEGNERSKKGHIILKAHSISSGLQMLNAKNVFEASKLLNTFTLPTGIRAAGDSAVTSALGKAISMDEIGKLHGDRDAMTLLESALTVAQSRLEEERAMAVAEGLADRQLELADMMKMFQAQIAAVQDTAAKAKARAASHAPSANTVAVEDASEV